MYEQILQQQSNPGKIINIAPGKLFLDNCIHAIIIQDSNRYNILCLIEISGVMISGTCVGTYDPSNYITSPNYPQNYGHNIDCRWSISNPGPKNLTLKLKCVMIFPGLNPYRI